MVKLVNKILGVLIIIPAIFFYILVWKDYSNNIKKIAEPMRDKVLKFEEKFGRYPTIFDESLELLKLSGCNAVDGKSRPRYEGEQRMAYTCKFWIKNMSIDAVMSKHATPYSLNFYMGYTRCHLLFAETKRTKILCDQYPLFKHNA